MLKKLLSLNFSLTYINNVFRFCFVGIMLTKVRVFDINYFRILSQFYNYIINTYYRIILANYHQLYYSIAAMCLRETLDINIFSGRIYGLYVRMWCNIAILHIMFLCSEINGGGKIYCYISRSYLVLLSK